MLLVIVGPTSSGKSELAVSLAKKYNGEIISCDSRQIYVGMDLGTGKVKGRWATFHPARGVGRASGRKAKNKAFVYKNIPHHLIDFVNPKKQYSVALFQKQARKIIEQIILRGHIPILCGGTMHYIDAVIYNQTLPDVKPDKKLRARLEKKSVEDLFKQLKKLDPARAKTIDKHNKRRVVRALEIILTTGKPITIFKSFNLKSLNYNTLWLGINPPRDILYKKIDKRLKERLKQGMIKEIQKLRLKGLSYKRLESFGLEYKYISLYLQKKLTYEEMLTQLSYAIKHYSKRQMTWWKRNKEIKWVENSKQSTKLLKDLKSAI